MNFASFASISTPFLFLFSFSTQVIAGNVITHAFAKSDQPQSIVEEVSLEFTASLDQQKFESDGRPSEFLNTLNSFKYKLTTTYKASYFYESIFGKLLHYSRRGPADQSPESGPFENYPDSGEGGSSLLSVFMNGEECDSAICVAFDRHLVFYPRDVHGSKGTPLTLDLHTRASAEFIEGSWADYPNGKFTIRLTETGQKAYESLITQQMMFIDQDLLSLAEKGPMPGFKSITPQIDVPDVSVTSDRLTLSGDRHLLKASPTTFHFKQLRKYQSTDPIPMEPVKTSFKDLLKFILALRSK